jgi:Flp pilus assembly protein TadD
LDEPIERTQRTFIKLSLGILCGILLLILFGWGGCRAYRTWEERQQVRHATAFLNAGKSNSAVLSARRALQLNPNSTAAMRIMAQLAERTRERVALDWRRKIVELEPDSTADAIALSNCALQFGDIRTAEKSLLSIVESARQTAEFHAAAGRLAKARKNPAEAKAEFDQARRLAPNEESYELEYALACLEHSSKGERDEGLRILEKLRHSPTQRAAATRALFADGVAHRHAPIGLLELARELQSYPEALFSDRLLYLDVLRQVRDAQYVRYLTEIEKDAASKPGDLGALLSWMNMNQMSLVAIDFARSLSPEVLKKWPVPWALAEAHAKISDWPALEKLTATANWGQFDFLRRAYLTRAFRGENNAAAATREWTAATKSAGAQSQSLLLLTRVIYDWGWKNEGIDLLWQLTKYPEVQFEALHTLYVHYSQRHDTQGLYRVLSRLNETDPGDLKVQNNLVQISLLLHVDRERAIKRATDLYRKEPSNPGYVSTYAFALYEKGDVSGALTAMRKLPDDQLREPSLAAYYAIFLAASGDKQKAREYLEQGKQANLLPEEKALLERGEATLQ